MIVQIAEAVHNYHAELRSRKSNGEMFAKKKRVQTTKSVQPIQSDLDEWKSRYTQQNAQKTDIPIQTPLFDKSTADHVVENIGELESSKPAPRKFEVKIFGIKLFSINY